MTAASAVACGACVFGLADQMLPPIAGWSILAVTWTLAVMVALTVTRTELPLVPPGPHQVLLVAGGVLASGVTGPLTTLPLAAMPLIATLMAKRRPELLTPAARRIILRIGVLHGIAVIPLVGVMAWRLATTTPQDTAIRWGGTAAGRRAMNELYRAEPASLDAYRAIVRDGAFPEATAAARRLAAIGDPAADRPLLAAAQARFRDEDYAASEIGRALTEMDARGVPSR